ncbi:MAG: hypothetical protein AAFZ65_02630 [Planctomycetota bacterium]
MDLLDLRPAALLVIAMQLATGRLLLGLCPPGLPGGGARSEWPGVLGASALLGLLVFSFDTRFDAEGRLVLALVALAGGAGLLRWMAGPAAMRPRRGPSPPPAEGAASRILGWTGLLALGALLAWRCLRPEIDAWPLLGPWPRSLGAWQDRWEPEAMAVYPIPVGLGALAGRVAGWSAARRRWTLAGGLTLAFATAPSIGRGLEPVLEASGSATGGELALVAASSATCLLALYRMRAERRCLTLAPFALLLSGLHLFDRDPPPAWYLATPIVVAGLAVPRAAWKQARAPFVAALTLALVLAR